MILSKVAIQGFKSFAKKTELKFDGSITSIVGPNGCGKTNIVDAIRWGLGEQRPSILRADRMDNIIFGGTQSSRPLGLAEVSIYFDNSKHILPIDYEEVVVTRRLYRSGESEYLLNKSSVRLKDIHDLIMDTGIGADGYSVIELKMVEDILSEKADDRRKLLEEAAGVTKYKHRLRAAVRKLESTQNDLIRVNDIVQEIERTVRSLKRQVQKAKRYQVLQEQIKDKEIRRSSWLLNDTKNKIKPLKEQIAQYQKQKEGRTVEISKDEADLETLKLRLVEKEKALAKIQEELNSSIERIHRRESDIRVGKERIGSLEERINRYTHEIEVLKKRLEDQKTHLDISTRDREALQVKITSKKRVFNNKKNELEVFQQGLNLKHLELNKKKREIIECLEEINRYNSEETQLRADNNSNRGRLARLDEEDQGYREALKRVQKQEKDLNTTFTNLENQYRKIISNRDRLISEEERLRKDIELAKERLYKDQSEHDLLQGRLSFLQNIIINREGMTDGAKKLLKGKVNGLVGVLAEFIEVLPEYRKAIEVGLGETTKYLIFQNVTTGIKALEYLKHQGGGNVTLVALDRISVFAGPGNHPKLPSDSDVVGWANELVDCKKRFKPVFDMLLGDLLIIKNSEKARKTAEKLSKHPIRIATLDGELFTGWGILHHEEFGDNSGSMVGRKQRVKELKTLILKYHQKISEAEKNIQEKETQLREIITHKTSLNQDLVSLDEQIIGVEKQRAKVQFEGDQAEEGMKKNGEERGKLLNLIESGKDLLENLRPKIEMIIDKREKLEENINRIQDEVDQLEKEEKIMEDEVHRHNLSVVRLNGEAQNLDYDIERSQKLIEEIQSTLVLRDQEIQEAKQDIEQYKTETEDHKKQLLLDFKEKEKQEHIRQERENEFHDLREELQNKEREIRTVRKDREEVSETIHNLQIEISEFEHQAQIFRERIWENHQVKLERVTPPEEIDLDVIEGEIDGLKQKIKILGPVNLVALQEYEQENERLNFLHQQRDDLLSAEETLKQTIKKINHTARNRFQEIFKEVRKNFKETFCRFFQGGEADLQIPEGEDPLEAPIQIFARPAGKQLRDLDLLSGGEKALTAISLLFALYMVKPSPFCILDEIDAPLDDANIQRFTRVLSEYAQNTQFIIVTHNKMTMRVAQALYGVTMEEEGVSKLVSVKFEENGDQNN